MPVIQGLCRFMCRGRNQSESTGGCHEEDIAVSSMADFPTAAGAALVNDIHNRQHTSPVCRAHVFGYEIQPSYTLRGSLKVRGSPHWVQESHYH